MRAFLFVFLIPAFTQGCFFHTTPAQAEKAAQVKAEPVEEISDWEKWLREFLPSKTGSDGQAFVLLSFGGFAGAGNGQSILTMEDKKGKAHRFYHFLPSHSLPLQDSKPEILEENLGVETISEFLTKASDFPEKGFKNKHPAMDGYTYEFFHFEAGNPLKLAVHLEMDYPGYSHDGSKPHQTILDAFRSLKSKAESLRAAENNKRKGEDSE